MVPKSTREALVMAAAELLDRGGPAAVTLREVGRRAGVSHNAPYKHFESKAALLASIAARELERRERTAARDPEPGPDAAHVAMLRYVRWALHHPERFRLTFGPWGIDNSELTEAATHARGRFIRAVQAAQASGRLPEADPERMSALLLASAHGAVQLQLSGHLSRQGKGRAAAKDLVDDLFKYLGGASHQSRPR
jgi:AcrR family transcriptional regulator